MLTDGCCKRDRNCLFFFLTIPVWILLQMGFAGIAVGAAMVSMKDLLNQ